MKNQWILSAAALFSLAGMISVGCAAPVDEATADAPVTTEASSDGALTGAADVGTATEALTDQCYRDGCRNLHQACRCRNTGWRGFCGVGMVHPGCVYCICD
jgi:hypothetical protein